MSKKYTIEIIYTPPPNEKWDYKINPQPLKGGATKPVVKHGDLINWVCLAADWTVLFKAETPLANKNEMPLQAVSNGPGLLDGGYISKTTEANESFSYYAELDFNDGNVPRRSPDPEIVIDENPGKGKRRKRKKGTKRKTSRKKAASRKARPKAKKVKRKK